MKAKIIMLRGLPASGKSTWAKEQVKPGGHVHRVSKDDLRAMLDNGHHSKPNEKIVIEVRNIIVQRCLFHSQTIIVDDTNFNPIHEKALREFAKVHGAEFQIKDFDTPLEECIVRDAARGDKSVGEKVIRDMYERYLAKRVIIRPTLVQDTKLPGAFLCDLDGTVALLGGRSPYDASTCEQDQINVAVTTVVEAVQKRGFKLIFVSGRMSTFRAQTEAWLKNNGFQYEALFMRKEGDDRKDSIIKREVLENEILPKYYIHFVFDDRDQVVEMWRSLGLTCFQVAPGNF